MLSNSKLGFGLMRLPKDKQGNIQIDEVQRMVDSFMDKGFNYFDTAYAYAGSEEAIKETLVKKYPRDSFTLADKFKLPIRYVGIGEKAEDLRPFKADIFVDALFKDEE